MVTEFKSQNDENSAFIVFRVEIDFMKSKSLTTFRSSKRAALTLFEVLLSLALILTLMTLIGTALNTHLRNEFQNRLQVEEAQLARVLLNRIANDIRHVMLTPDQNENAASTGESEDEYEEYDDTETDSEYYDDESYYEDGYDYFDNDIVGTKLGIYGGRNWIQIDTYRAIPGERFTYEAEDPYNYSYNQDDEEYISELDLVSCGQKTVLYYLGYETGTTEGDEEFQLRQRGSSVEPERYRQGLLNSSNLQYGLYYREMNRAIMDYAVEMGLDAAYYMTEYDEQLAPEVDKIEFLYYINDDPDHSPLEGEWLNSWDMDAENGELPLAIEIRLSIRRKNYKPTLIGGLLSSDDEQERIVTYSLVVPLSREMIDLTINEDDYMDAEM